MKLFSQLIILILLLLTSCRMEFNNFNKQKFTKLNKLDPVVEHQENTTKNFIKKFNSPVIKNIGTDKDSSIFNTRKVTKFVKNDDIDPKDLALIKKQIAEGKPLIIKKGDNYYKLEEAKYDQYYKAAIGKYKKIDKKGLPKEHLLIETDDFNLKLGKLTVYTKSIKVVKHIKLSDNEKTEIEEATVDEKEENRDKTSPHMLQRYEKKVKIFHVLALCSLAVMAVVGIIYIFYAIPVLIGLFTLAYIAGFVFRLIGVILFRKYKKYAEAYDAKEKRRTKIRRNMMLAGIILQALPVALLIGIIVYFIITF